MPNELSKKLNLGCGELKKEGYVNLDWRKIVNPDVIHDLNSFPYPFPDNYFDLIEASHILEHLDKPFSAMSELHRILKSGGRLIIRVPHFSRGFTHAEHAHGFDVTFPFYFNKKFSKFSFTGAEFELRKVKMQWMSLFHLMSDLGYGGVTVALLKLVNGLISFFANLNPNFCSRVWCFWVGGFEEIEFEFVCVK